MFLKIFSLRYDEQVIPFLGRIILDFNLLEFSVSDYFRFKKQQVETFLSRCQMFGSIWPMFILLKAILHWR